MRDHHELAKDAGLVVDPTQVVVRFREPAPQTMRARVAGRALEAEPGEAVGRFEIPGEKYTVFELPRSDKPYDRLDAAIARLNDDPLVEDVAPVYLAGANRLITPDRVAVGFRRDAAGTLKFLEGRGYRVLEQRGSEYLVQLPAGESALEHAREIRGHDDVLFSEADFVEFGDPPEPGPEEPLAEGVPDPYLTSQWALTHTGTDAALTLVGKGSAGIRIAILDTGIDRAHPDLEDNVAGAWDATEAKPKPHPLEGDWHGTACAGLAAAIPGNGEGIRGFGGGCSILDVRVLHSEGKKWKLAASAVARGIRLALDNHADVISLSWASHKEHPSVTSAIAEALRDGRDKKGCVVVAGTGNDTSESDPGVKYPARLGGVIAVAATNKEDQPVERKRDGTSWSSAGGEQVALAAPGIRQWTTDITGINGLVPLEGTSGNYTGQFAGTSASTAMVAGVAGLMLTADPALEAADVRAILREKAFRPPGFDPLRLGAGRLDAGEAVKEVIRRRKKRESAPAPAPPPAEMVFVHEETVEVNVVVEVGG